MPPLQPNKSHYLSEQEAANYLSLSPSTLRNWRVAGGGPPFVKISKRCIRYRRSDLDQWAEARVRKSTADRGFLRGFA